MAVVITSLEEQLADAVRICRSYRHHSDCRCNTWRDREREGFCTAQEATWNRVVSNALDRVLGRLV